MNTDLSKLKPYDAEGNLQVIVEAPKGSSLKLEFDVKKRLFTISRALPLGMVYPFDWGFVPGTVAADGDPVDALVVYGAATYPGVLLPCRLLGMVELEQTEKASKRESNNRIIATPSWHEPLKEIREASDLPRNIQRELEQFFVDVTVFTGKKVTIRGWANRRAAKAYIDANRR